MAYPTEAWSNLASVIRCSIVTLYRRTCSAILAGFIKLESERISLEHTAAAVSATDTLFSNLLILLLYNTNIGLWNCENKAVPFSGIPGPLDCRGVDRCRDFACILPGPGFRLFRAG
jgi:hypothetical protein